MNAVWKRSKTVLKCWAILCAGVVAPFVFPPFVNIFWGYLALIGFLAFLFFKPRSKKELFGVAYLFGFGFYCVGFSWINNALLIEEDRFSAFIPLVIFAIGAFFGLFWAIPALFAAGNRSVYQRMIAFSAAFVLMEWVRSFIFTGFPWNLLGTALSFSPYFIQGAAYIGTYGLSLLLLLFCCGTSLFIIGLLQKRFYRGSAVFLLLPMVFIWGAARQIDNSQCLNCDVQNKFVVRLMQPSIPQTFKWHPALLYKNFRQYIDLSKVGAEEGFMPLDEVDLVVWGETATPYFLDRDEEHRLEIKEAIPKGGFLATGILRAGMENGRIVPYNSLYVLDDKADIKDYYDKSHLVPFGEYLPFRDYLPDFMAPVADVVGDLGKGEKYKNINIRGLPLMGGAICYESIFPKQVLNPDKKPDILLVLANDGWYGISAGPYQHLAATQMRAVEEGITVIRSANTGISAVIEPSGRIVKRIELNDIGVADIKLNFPLAKDTFYGRYGNIIPLSLIAVMLLFVVISGIKRKK